MCLCLRTVPIGIVLWHTSQLRQSVWFVQPYHRGRVCLPAQIRELQQEFKYSSGLAVRARTETKDMVGRRKGDRDHHQLFETRRPTERHVVGKKYRAIPGAVEMFFDLSHTTLVLCSQRTFYMVALTVHPFLIRKSRVFTWYTRVSKTCRLPIYPSSQLFSSLFVFYAFTAMWSCFPAAFSSAARRSCSSISLAEEGRSVSQSETRPSSRSLT